MRRAYAIRPYGILGKYSLGGHFQTQILVYPVGEWSRTPYPINPGSNRRITFEPTFLQYRF